MPKNKPCVDSWDPYWHQVQRCGWVDDMGSKCESPQGNDLHANAMIQLQESRSSASNGSAWVLLWHRIFSWWASSQRDLRNSRPKHNYRRDTHRNQTGSRSIQPRMRLTQAYHVFPILNVNHKALTRNNHGMRWRLVPPSLRWLGPSGSSRGSQTRRLCARIVRVDRIRTTKKIGVMGTKTKESRITCNHVCQEKLKASHHQPVSLWSTNRN